MNDYSFNNENNEQQTYVNNTDYKAVGNVFGESFGQCTLKPSNGFDFNSDFSEKKKNKKILRKMGSIFGLAILLYIILSDGVSLLAVLTARNVPAFMELIRSSTGSWAFQGILSVICLAMPFYIAYLRLKSKKYTGVLPFGTTYNKKAAVSLVMFLTPTLLISTIIINIISHIIQQMLNVSFTSGLEDIQVDGAIGAITLTLTVAVIPAIVEEFCIRGVILQPLRRYGDKFAIVMSALIFSILHGNMVQVPYTFVGGLFFGYLCVATGSIWPSIMLHFINNFTQVIETVALTTTAGTGIIILMWLVLIVMGIAGGSVFFRMNYKPELKKGVTCIKTGKKVSAVFLNVPMILSIIYLLGNVLFSINT